MLIENCYMSGKKKKKKIIVMDDKCITTCTLMYRKN